ncbi:alpha-ketoacid dehydrogenase subunit alpha/beta [Namhaeicola litoreus]|uniref:Thiamine pyrophosphate-dependent enzyme n=1 Tax=Namhaeicola litoreus TaxID=1052145 RepID=A0ABW3Y3M3_9FLAO
MNSPMSFETSNLSQEMLIQLYQSMLKPRLIEEKMLVLLRQGKISKWFSGIGQEAISIGVTLSLQNDEFILPMHRNLGVFTSRNIPLRKLFAQWQGKLEGFSKGRERSFHFGTQEYKIVGMISHLGPQLGIANGIALAEVLKNTNKLTAVFTGEGGTSEGDFHEALNVASVWKLPVLFCIENNGYGLSTPISEQFNCENLADRALGYGMESHIIDGNNVVDVYQKVNEIAKSVRVHPRPVLLEFKTFRVRGHEEASGTKYVPQELLDFWAAKDPLENFRAFLKDQNILCDEVDIQIKEAIVHEINEELDIARAYPEISFNEENEISDVYANSEFKLVHPSEKTKELRFVDAVSEALDQSMERFPDLVLMGQDIAEYGGVFKITEGFVEKYGKARVRNTPICESSIIETAYGLSVKGIKSVVELQFSDFVTSGFNPVVNVLAKSYYRWGQMSDTVLRMPCGAGVGAGPFHSQTNEAWFFKTPGLKVVYPAFPADAKGLLATAIEDPNPVIFFEHKMLYRSVRENVPTDYYHIPFGKANVLKSGNDITVVTYGAAVHWVIEIVQKEKISADLIDLRSLIPLDTETIFESVKKTNRVIIVQEDTLFGGLASEISALITENCFQYLDAPVKRVGSLETPVPFSKTLEDNFLPINRIEKAMKELLLF